MLIFQRSSISPFSILRKIYIVWNRWRFLIFFHIPSEKMCNFLNTGLSSIGGIVDDICVSPFSDVVTKVLVPFPCVKITSGTAGPALLSCSATNSKLGEWFSSMFGFLSKLEPAHWLQYYPSMTRDGFGILQSTMTLTLTNIFLYEI